ncbi:hypothetical protein [Flammeovirga sp. SJP92]|uniref:hypothetical protein n=1 Tax=Flammeovirga sp. SJP92 TaxID=1775430 RepID=UPI000788ADC1|nr:hypothetical protein [Flammeovirga sp. SJP92]KXX67385.1 hypothetical protein AVL50_27195 [Flammeovirga sp. SJP92]
MNKLVKLGLFTLLLIGFACQTKINETVLTPDDNSTQLSNVRMPFSQKVYLLNNKDGISDLYEVSYDFQGLGSTTTLNHLKTFNGHSHMTVSPDGETLVIVNNGSNKKGVNEGKIFFYQPESGAEKSFKLRKANGKGNVNINKKVGITQVDFDRKGRLFIAGGFYEVVPTMTLSNGSLKAVSFTSDTRDWWDFTTLDPTTMEYLTTKNYLRAAATDAIIAEDEDDDVDQLTNDYFSNDQTSTVFTPNSKLKFKGGDITFTQSSTETGGFEEEHLITFTRAYGGAAIKVKIGMDANGKPKVQGDYLFNIDKKVTGAALMGDNHVIVSTAGKNAFKIYSLDGEMIVSPTITFTQETINKGKAFAKTSAGDMACTQVFDLEGESGTDGLVTDRVIRNMGGANDDAWYHEHWNLAEMKLYRPNYPYGVTPDDMPDVNVDQRKNAANADIADLRQRPKLFTSLGGNGGYAVMKFRAPTVVTNSTYIQVVETTWGRNPDYEYYKKDNQGIYYEDASAIQSAWNSYAERAKVYVWVSSDGNQPRYINDTWIGDTNSSGFMGQWVEIGTARLTNNIFPLAHIAENNNELNYGDVIQWVKIVDFESEESDCFDINFVSAFSDYCEDYGIGNFDNITDKNAFVNTYLRSYNYADRLDQNNEEGLVSFTNNPKSVHSSFMEADFGDNVMVINAAQDDNPDRSSYNNPGLADDSRTFFKDYIPVLAGETYYFSAEVINVIRWGDINNPMLDMYIDYNIGFNNSNRVSLDQPIDLSEDVDWQQMYLEFTAPASGIITIGIAEVSDKWLGNDFAIDNIAFSCNPPIWQRTSPCEEVLKINFEDNNDAPYTSEYTLAPNTSNSLIPQGMYIINNDPNFNHFYFTLFENNSTAMVVNGSTSSTKPDALNTTLMVENGARYKLSVDLGDVNISSDPDVNMIVTIDGVDYPHLIPDASGTGSQGWTTFEKCWVSNVTGSINISIRSDNTMASGNDFGIDNLKVLKDCSDCQ